MENLITLAHVKHMALFLGQHIVTETLHVLCVNCGRGGGRLNAIKTFSFHFCKMLSCYHFYSVQCKIDIQMRLG